MENTAMVEFRV